MRLFDLHCDTAYRLYREKLPFTSPKLHINDSTISRFAQVTQVFAFWTDKRDANPEAWTHFLECYTQFLSVDWPKNLSILLSIEDLRLIDGKLERIALLKKMGISFVGLFWSGENAFGSAHNSEPDRGLTDLGKEAVKECFKLGIIVDVSHASVNSTEQILDLAEQHNQTVVASHSDFFECANHTRNLLTHHAKRIHALGGLIGLSFVPEHLGGFEIEHFLRQAEYGMHLGLADSLCIGSDFDGTDNLIHDISSQRDVHYLHAKLKAIGFTKSQRNNLFWKNGIRFLKRTNISPIQFF